MTRKGKAGVSVEDVDIAYGVNKDNESVMIFTFYMSDNTTIVEEVVMKKPSVEYVMEAEYTDLDEVAGAGISNDSSGLSMIYGDGTAKQKEMWSNGYYVGYTHNAQTELTFVFNSSLATTANVVLMLGSELGDVTLNPENFSVLVNGEEQYYGAWSVAGSEMNTATFTTCELSSPVGLKAGENKIVLKVLPNTLIGGGGTGGPLIDCIKVTTTHTSASLTWTPHKDNPERRDNEV